MSCSSIRKLKYCRGYKTCMFEIYWCILCVYCIYGRIYELDTFVLDDLPDVHLHFTVILFTQDSKALLSCSFNKSARHDCYVSDFYCKICLHYFGIVVLYLFIPLRTHVMTINLVMAYHWLMTSWLTLFHHIPHMLPFSLLSESPNLIHKSFNKISDRNSKFRLASAVW